MKKTQTDEFFSIVTIRWNAIQAYFMGNIEMCIKYLENALTLAKDLKQPTWVINDILIDLRNQQIRRLSHAQGVSASTKSYIMGKCESDPNYVVRMVCSEEMRTKSKR